MSSELRAAAENLLKYVHTHRPEDYPERAHDGCCGPEAGCDCNCMDAAAMSEHDAAIRRLTRAIAEEDKQSDLFRATLEMIADALAGTAQAEPSDADWDNISTTFSPTVCFRCKGPTTLTRIHCEKCEAEDVADNSPTVELRAAAENLLKYVHTHRPEDYPERAPGVNRK